MAAVRDLLPLLAALAAVPLWGGVAAGADLDRFEVSVGAFDGVKFDMPAAELRVEYRSGLRILNLGRFFGGIGPMLGAMANSDGGLYGYGGIYAELYPIDGVVLSPVVAVGAYEGGDGRDLGGTLEFYSAVTLAYQFDNDHRLGVTLGHLSNAGLNDRNPGTESLLLAYSIPFGPLFSAGTGDAGAAAAAVAAR